MNVPDQLFRELCTHLAAAMDEHTNKYDVMLGIKHVAPRILGLRTGTITPPVTHSYDDDYVDEQPARPRSTRTTEPADFTFDPAAAEKLHRVGPLPEDEPGYGSQRTNHRQLPNHLAACPAQLGGVCTCPVPSKR